MIGSTYITPAKNPEEPHDIFATGKSQKYCVVSNLGYKQWTMIAL